MAAIAPDLRPRGPAELYDAALHLCVRGGTALPALSLLGAVLPAVAGLALLYRAVNGRPYLGAAALFAFSVMVRGVLAGAAALAAEAAIEERPIGAGAALRRALARAPSLLAAGGMLALLHWVFAPATLWIGLAFWSPLYAAPLLVARGEAGVFRMGAVCRRRLASESTFLLRLLHGLALVIVLVNLHSGILVGLYLAHALLAFDSTFVQQFTALSNPVYDGFLVGLASIVLEPVRNALGVLLVVDARVRSEGLDLRAAVERLSVRRPGAGGLAALGLVAVLAAQPAYAAQPAQAEAGAESDDVERLRGLMVELGAGLEADDLEALEAASRLRGPEQRALRHFVDALERRIDSGEDGDVIAQSLEEGLAEIRGLGNASDSSVEQDPRSLAREILARPEFEPVRARAKVEKPDDSESWLVRFLRWLFERDEQTPKEVDEPKPVRCGMGPGVAGVGGGSMEVLTYVLTALAIVGLLVLVGHSLRRVHARPTLEVGAAAGSGDAASGPEVVSALSRPPEGWWSEADRLAARGEYREAVRALYLAVLASLHRAGTIEYEPTRSNWDYVRAFHGASGQRAVFRELTTRFDFVWYGRLGADEVGYARVRTLAGPILSGELRADA